MKTFFARTIASIVLLTVGCSVPALATDVCGNISGVWDLVGSPYYVNCEVTVPAGQTLAIQAGVRVLFGGHFKFYVHGGLRAVGTEQDSIVFTRRFPTEESKWAGIRFEGTTDSCLLSYCLIEYGNAVAGSDPYDNAGGGMLCLSSSPIIRHCTVRRSYGFGGGGIHTDSSHVYLYDCLFTENTAYYGAGVDCWHSLPTYVRCVITNNTATFGGGASFGGSSPVFQNCTLVGNTGTSGPGGLYCGDQFSSATLNNTIIANSVGPGVDFAVSTATINHCDFWNNSGGDFAHTSNGPSGIGQIVGQNANGTPADAYMNIFQDPMFVDDANGDFHLRGGSPCIDAGDPNSPLDPNGTIVDMGAFPFTHGLSVCGNVSGVWDSTDSPYYVNCDVTVPTGQTLEIRPGVQVRFTGHYKFNVNGNLQAIGTQQDSIVFTRAFPTEESRGRGIRPSDSSAILRFEYCVIEYGSAYGNEAERQGGGLGVESADSIVAERCTFRYNTAADDGGGAAVWHCTYARFFQCTFAGNNGLNGPGGLSGGGLDIDRSTNAFVERCLFYANTSSGGGALAVGNASLNANQITVASNTGTGGGGALEYYNSTVSIRNAILWNNGSTPIIRIAGGPDAVLSYSDIQGGYAGTGNIDTDPMFVDTANGNFHLRPGSPCIDTGDPNSPLDPDGSRADMGAFYWPHCLPTPLPFVDSFDSPALDSCWYWLREDTTHHSLATRPGWMRITTQGGEIASDAHNILLRPRLTDDLVLETHMAFNPTTNYQQAGLTLWLDSTRHVLFHRYYSGGQKLMFRGDHAGSGYDYSSYIANADTNLYLRLTTNGTLVTASYSTNGTTWTTFGSHDFPWISDSTQVGVFACNGSNYSAPQIRADFDYVGVQPNCPKYVSGAWTLSHSPYRITCQTIVPVGQTLTIDPGVEVRFDADVDLRVLGNLIAEGTSQDSITFWADTLRNPNRWAGVRFSHAEGTNRLANCKFLNGSCTASDVYQVGGAVFCDSSLLTITHCLFEGNQAKWGGAVNFTNPLAGSRVDSSLFTGNSTVCTDSDCAGGAVCIFPSAIPVRGCLFAHNIGTYGGALALRTGSVEHCTFADNSSIAGGAAAYASNGNPAFNSCIFSQNGGTPLFYGWPGASPTIAYSDIQDMGGGFSNLTPPPGFGLLSRVNANGDSTDVYFNRFVNPLFANTSDYSLAWNSSCFDAGDPALPHDPDGTIADQGYLSYYQPTLTAYPVALDFGQLLYGDTAMLQFTLTNPSPTRARLTGYYRAYAMFAIDTATFPAWIPAHSAANINVHCIPTTEGEFADTLKIASRLAGPDNVLVALHVSVPFLPVDPESLVVKVGAPGNIELHWAPVTHSTSGHPITPQYLIYGATNPSGPFTLLDTSPTNSYTHVGISGVLPRLYYRVTAFYGSVSAASVMPKPEHQPRAARISGVE